MQTTTRADGVTIVNDAYNANPDSMRHALNALAAMTGGVSQRSVAVLGRMNELGDDAYAAHVDIGRYAAGRDLDQGHSRGRGRSQWMLDGVQSGGGTAVCVPDQDTALHLLHSILRPGDVILVKASRGVQPQKLANPVNPGGS
ncbi:glutamate ligase domain-containing protein [Streptomyces chartreusis]|uniref:glutamate ligase domain-containing protein n=1 Tax=Streptomyces chartreusis TaxID=1969 RepID=UPI0036783E91